jgi:outer membrane protein OmpU
MNIKKIGATALAGALVSVSANAAELSVTGGASLGFSGEEKTDKGNGWTMNDGISFSASAEMDNGWVVSTSMLIDSGDGVAGAVIDNRSMKIDMGDAGTLTFYGDGGSSNISLMDDTTPTAGEEAWDDVSGATAHAYGPTGYDTFFTKTLA